jgi:hypothetical protein
MNKNEINMIESLDLNDIEIEALSDEALESVAGGSSSDGPQCCSCLACSRPPQV